MKTWKRPTTTIRPIPYPPRKPHPTSRQRQSERNPPKGPERSGRPYPEPRRPSRSIPPMNRRRKASSSATATGRTTKNYPPAIPERRPETTGTTQPNPPSSKRRKTTSSWWTNRANASRLRRCVRHARRPRSAPAVSWSATRRASKSSRRTTRIPKQRRRPTISATPPVPCPATNAPHGLS